MRAQSLPLVLSLALAATAVPFDGAHHRHQHRNPTPVAELAPRSSSSADDFDIIVTNNCGSTLSFGVFQVSSTFSMNTITQPVEIASGDNGTISAPYSGIGMRLSGTADQGAAAQWGAQALFEFGYSAFNGIDGTAYDLSVMGGDVGLAVYPANTQCPSKLCASTSCAPDQGWTNPNQVDDGSPADTVCYHGKTNFNVVWCAS